MITDSRWLTAVLYIKALPGAATSGRSRGELRVISAMYPFARYRTILYPLKSGGHCEQVAQGDLSFSRINLRVEVFRQELGHLLIQAAQQLLAQSDTRER